MHFDNDIHGGECEETDQHEVRFEAYYQMAERLRAGQDDVALLGSLYKSIPASHKYELLIKCASLSASPKCFGYLFDALYDGLKQPHFESDLSKILDCLMINNCVDHLEYAFDRFQIQQCRLVNSVVLGVDEMSHAAVQMVLSKSSHEVAASALNQAFTLSLSDPKYYEMVKTIAPLCGAQHLPDVVFTTMQEYFAYRHKDHSLAVLEEFVIDLDPKTFKKVYQKVHSFVKEHGIESIKARYSKDKMMTQLEGLGATVEHDAALPRRKM